MESHAPPDNRGVYTRVCAGLLLHEAGVPPGSLYTVQGYRLPRGHIMEPVADMYYIHTRIWRALRLARQRRDTYRHRICRHTAGNVS